MAAADKFGVGIGQNLADLLFLLVNYIYSDA